MSGHITTGMEIHRIHHRETFDLEHFKDDSMLNIFLESLLEQESTLLADNPNQVFWNVSPTFYV